MSSECILCRLADGAESVSLVYDDGGVIGLMSLDQPTSHKVIVAPRAHVPTIYDLDDSVASGLFIAAARISRAVRDATECQGLNVVQSNGEIAGQEVPHFHMHLIPREQGDEVILRWPSRDSARPILDEMANEIRNAIKVAK